MTLTDRWGKRLFYNRSLPKMLRMPACYECDHEPNENIRGPVFMRNVFSGKRVTLPCS